MKKLLAVISTLSLFASSGAWAAGINFNDTTAQALAGVVTGIADSGGTTYVSTTETADTIIAKSANTGTDSMMEWRTGADVLAAKINGDMDYFFYNDSARYTKIDGNNITLNGNGAVGNYIYGYGSSYVRFPVGNGNQYFSMLPGTGSTEILRLSSATGGYKGMSFRDQSVQVMGTNYSAVSWISSFEGTGEIRFGQATMYSGAVEAVNTYIQATQGRSGHSSYPGGDIFIEPGEGNADGGRAGNVAMATSWGNVGIGISSPAAKLHTKSSPNIALTGTVSVTLGTAAVTGSGTAFDTELAVGDSIKIEDETFTVSAIGSATTLTLDSNHVAGASAVAAYSDPDLFRVDNGDSVEKFTIDKSGIVNISDVDAAPATTTNKLYSDSGSLYWDGAELQTGAAGLTNRIENTATTSFAEFGTSGADTFMTVKTSSTTSTDKIINLTDGNDADVLSVLVDGTISLANTAYSIGLGNSTISGTEGISIGRNTKSNTQSISIGSYASSSDTTGVGNTVVGAYARQFGNGGTNSVAVGRYAGLYMSGDDNIILGYNSAKSASFASDDNVLIGGQIAATLTTGGSNVGIGHYAMRYVTTGINNVTLGFESMYGVNGQSNTISDNVVLGYRAGYGLQGSNSILLGKHAGYYETASNGLYISSIINTDQVDEATAKTKAIIYGAQDGTTTANQTLALNAQVKATYGLEVGAGTTDTAGLIQWDGANFQGYDGSGWVNLDTQGSSGITIGDAVTSSTTGSIFFADGSSQLGQDNANLFWDDTNDRLGIGTATPFYQLQIDGGGGASYMSLTNTQSGSGSQDGFQIGLEQTTNDVYFLLRENADMYFRTNNQDRMFIDNGGNVGIGSTGPGGRLVVVGAGDTSATYGLNVTDDGGSSNFFVRDDGNVGIGTTSPGATLEVNGTTAFTPSTTASVTAAGGLTVTNGLMRVAGDAAAIDITADPQIVDGVDGQIVIIQGDSDTNTLKFDDGTGLALSGAVSFTMGKGDMLQLAYDLGDDIWYEITRSDN